MKMKSPRPYLQTLHIIRSSKFRKKNIQFSVSLGLVTENKTFIFNIKTSTIGSNQLFHLAKGWQNEHFVPIARSLAAQSNPATCHQTGKRHQSPHP